MDTLTHAIPVRSARDRLIDLLGIGDTYPLTDLNVVADQLKVPFGGTAKIPIENAQAGVIYELCDPKGQPLGDRFKAEGHDATLVIETPQVTENITYRIRATKKPLGSTRPPQGSRLLDETAPVQVGLDLTLVIEIAGFTAPGVPVAVPPPLLDPAIANPRPSDPRIVPYGALVNVRVNNSQEGVEYSLMLDGEDAGGPAATGDLAAVILPAGPIGEDTVIQVRATKNFLAAENRSPETKPLDAKLSLKVSANPALAVSVDASPIVDYQRDATVAIAASQRSAKYRVYVHAIRDSEFVRGAPADSNIVVVPVAGKPSVQVRKPDRPAVWHTPAGYAPSGDPVPGTGSDLKFTLKALEEDTIVIVQAIKDHQVDSTNAASPVISSAIGFDQAAVVLVRPDPGRRLALRVPVIGAQTSDVMQVSNGQPGVFYYFRPAPAGAEFQLPAYFHKRDDQDATRNKGVGQLGVQVDFAIAADPDAAPAGRPADPSGVFPRPPLLNITPVATGSSLSSRAVKAQTALETPMTIAAPIAALPAIRPDQPVIDHGGTVTIVIVASRPGDQYQLMLRGAPVKPAVAGNDADVSVTTDPLTADALFEVLATRPGDKGMSVTRAVQVPIVVRPDATLPMAAKEETVDKGRGTDIVLQSSQQGVSYQLMSGQDAAGSPVPGNGAAITLPTGPIAADTTFTVVATRADNVAITVVLKERATVKVNA